MSGSPRVGLFTTSLFGAAFAAAAVPKEVEETFGNVGCFVLCGGGTNTEQKGRLKLETLNAERELLNRLICCLLFR